MLLIYNMTKVLAKNREYAIAMNKYWFRKSKNLILGSIPISWEGWLTIAVFFGLVWVLGLALGLRGIEFSLTYGVFIVGVILMLIVAAILMRSRIRPTEPEPKK